MGRTACAEPQCLYKGAPYLTPLYICKYYCLLNTAVLSDLKIVNIKFFSSLNRLDPLWGLTQLHVASKSRVFFPRVKQPEREVSHSHLSSAEVTNGWRYTSIPPICLRDVDESNFTFFLYTDWRMDHIRCYYVTVNYVASLEPSK